MDTLIVVAPLCQRPTDSLALRGLLLTTKSLKLDTIVEVEQQLKDEFYRGHRADGLFDFVSYLITPQEREEALRLDQQYRYPLTVVTDAVRFENVHQLIGQLVHLRQLTNPPQKDSGLTELP